LTIDIAARTGTVFIGMPASEGSGGSDAEAKPVFESSVPGGGSSIDDWDRLSSDTLTMQAPKFICLSDGPLSLPVANPKK
jgi:hypothetical protein